MRKLVTPLALLDLIYYDPTSPSGLRWKVQTSRRIKAHEPAGCIYGRYYRLGYKGKTYACHVLIWELHNGPRPLEYDVDHKDTNRLNNLIDNLRLATHGENQHNSNKNTTKTGIKGLYKYEHDPKYLGAISHRGIKHTFKSLIEQEVIDWLKAKREELHGQYARH